MRLPKSFEFVRWLADFYLLATLLMLVAIVARRWIRQPAQRLTVHWIVAVELAVLAAVCAMPFWPRVSLRGAAAQKSAVEKPAITENLMPRATAIPQTPFPRLPREIPEFDATSTSDVDQPAVPPVAPPRHWSWLEMTAAAYLASAGLVVAWLIWGAVAATRACWHAENAPDSLRDELMRIVGVDCRAPRLLTSSRVKTAVALGLRRPTILLPAGLLQEASPQAIRAILTHEWAHIRNGDLWLLALGRCLLMLLFPHPLLWWLRRAIRGDQELLADAAAAGDNRPAYAEELLRLVRKTAYPSPIAASVAVGIWESPSQLSRRIAMLLDESFHVEPRASRRWRYRALAVLVLLGGAASLMTFQPARSAAPPAQARSSAAPRFIQPLDVLQIRIYNVPANSSINGQHLVDVGGQVSLGHMYGQVKVLGLTRKEAEAAIREKLRETVPDPQVEITIRGREAPWTADTLQAGNSAAESVQAGKIDINAEPDDSIQPPVYRLHLIADPAVRKELNLSAEQVRKLRAIRKKYDAEDAESNKTFDEAMKNTKKLPPRELAKLATKLSNERARWMMAKIKEVRKQAEEVLTPGQLELLKEEMLRELAYSRIANAPYSGQKGLDMLKLTKEQNAKLFFLRNELEDWNRQKHYAFGDKILRFLTPEQTARLREEALGPLGPSDHLEPLSVSIEGEKEPYYVFTLAPYPDFTQAGVRKELGLSGSQEQQVRDILGGSTNLAERLTRDLEKLSPEERKKLKASDADATDLVWSVYGESDAPEKSANKMIEERKKERVGFAKQPVMKPALALRKRFEAVLTPEQLARYQDLAARAFAANAMGDQLMLKMIGASKEQQAEVSRFYNDYAAEATQFFRELGRRLLTILTPSQQAALRADFEKELIEGETMHLQPDQPAPAKPPDPPKASGGTLTLTGSQGSQRVLNLGDHSDGFDPTFQLPVHLELCNANSRKRFGIEFSAEQWKKLRAISADWQKQSNELFTKDRPKTTDQKQLEKFWTLVEPKLIDLIQSYGKQVDAVLTPEQLQKYQRFKTGECVRQPQFLKSMGVELTSEQQKKVEQADREDAEKWYQDLDRETQLVVAALSREQREQLRIAVGQESSASEEFTWKLACQSKPDEMVSKEGGHFNWVVPDAKYANLAFEQRAIQYTPIAKKLELSADQLKQLSALDAEQQSKTEKLLGETLKLPQDQRNRPEVSEKAARIRMETRQRIDAILTTRQRNVLKDHETESWALKVFRQSLPGNPNTAAFGSQQKISLNEQQLAILRRVLQDVATKMELNNRERDRRSSDILTEEQQNKIRDYYIKLRAW